MLDFGYLLIVNNDETGNYHDMAYLLASSIKKTQPEGYDNVCLITDNKEYIKRKDIVYNTIKHHDEIKGWDQRNYMINYSPYKHTVCLDVDMMFTRDISHWIDHFINKSNGLVITKNVLKFNGDLITSLKCRPGYKENNLPVLYSGFTYFNKESGLAQQFFKLVFSITQNKEIYRNLYMNKKHPSVMGTDEVFSIAVKILGAENQISTNTVFPKFVHLKSELQEFGIRSIEKDLGFYLDDNANVTVGTFPQTEIIHYSEKQFPINALFQMYTSLFLKGIKHV